MEYWDGTQYLTITGAINLANNGSFAWSVPKLDTTSYIRLTASDAMGNVTSIVSPSFTIDSTPPTIKSVQTIGDGNGQINGVQVFMSKVINTSLTLSGFSIAGSAITSTSTSTVGTGTVVQLNFASTGTTASTGTLVYTAGTVADVAGNALANTSKTITDAAPPVIQTTAYAYDNGSTGKINKIVATFSENIANTADTSAWSITAPLTITSVSTSGTAATLTVSGSTTTSLSGVTLTFTPTANYADSLANSTVSATPITVGLVDLAPPKLLSTTTSDIIGSGSLTAVTLHFSESLTGSIAGFTLSGVTVSGSAYYAGSNTNIVIPVVSTSNTALTPSVTYSGTSLTDTSGNTLSNTTVTASDSLAPYVLSRITEDTNHNGHLDTIALAFSETLGGSVNGLSVNVG